MKKQKESLRPTELYKQIVKALKVEGISPNNFNVKVVIKELNGPFVTNIFTNDIIQYHDVLEAVNRLKSPNMFYSELAYHLAKRNQNTIGQTTKFLKQEMKDIEGEDI